MGFLFFSNKTISVLGLMWSLEKVFDACTLVQIGLFSHHSSQGIEMHTSDFFFFSPKRLRDIGGEGDIRDIFSIFGKMHVVLRVG